MSGKARKPKAKKPANPVGRPTKYSPAILTAAREYCENWKELGDVIPMICGMANYIGIAKPTLEAWEKEDGKAEFSALCARVRAEQEQVLINKGLSRAADASLSKLLLRKHGYSDGQEIDHTTLGEKITQPRIIIGAQAQGNEQ